MPMTKFLIGLMLMVKQGGNHDSYWRFTLLKVRGKPLQMVNYGGLVERVRHPTLNPTVGFECVTSHYVAETI